jgi:superkiller protein 3
LRRNEDYLEAGIKAYENGDFSKAEKEFETLLQNDPHYVEGYYCLSGVLFQFEKFKDAISVLQKGLAIDPTSTKLRHSLGYAFNMIGEQNKAEQEFIKTLDQDPNDAVANFQLGLILFSKGRAHEAIEHYEKALEYEQSEAIYESLALAHQSIHQDEIAIDYLKKAIELNPDSPTLRHKLGTLYLTKGNLRSATEELYKLVELDPHNSIAHNHLGVVFARRKQFEKAMSCFLKAIEIDPRNAIHYCCIASIHHKHNKFDDALKYLQIAVELDPDSATIHSNIGLTLIRKGDHTKGIEILEKQVEKQPYRPMLIENLVEGYTEAGYYDKALKTAEEELQKRPKNEKLTQLLITIKENLQKRSG